MNKAALIIKNEIHNQNVIFVFPTDIDAKLNTRYAATLKGVGSVALNRFLAWDSFLEAGVKTGILGRKKATHEARLLFAYNLVKKNAEKTFLNIIIPKEYAENGQNFAASISVKLPLLNIWYKKKLASNTPFDSEDADLLCIRNEYEIFLKNTNHYETAWEELNFDNSKRYIIFYPQLIEKWTLYKDVLSDRECIQIIPITKNDLCPLRQYETSRAELRGTILNILELHDEKSIPFEDIAISVPDLVNIEPYIIKEFSLYDIPVHLHSGKYLADYATGSFFKAINECSLGNWTFDSLKKLLLNINLPWKNPDANAALIQHGIKNYCVCGYYEDSKYIDVWEQTLAAQNIEKTEVPENPKNYLYNYYIKLKQKIKKIVNAKTFNEIGKYYFDFRDNFFTAIQTEEDAYNENDSILSRCVLELYNLIDIEKKHEFLTPNNPFGFFISILQSKQYIPRRAEYGVNIFDYKVASASPFDYHFVINAAQSTATVIWQPFNFLRKDKRQLLKIDDVPASEYFFYAYNSNARSSLYVSACEHSFSGWVIPHSFFVGLAEKTMAPDCVYTTEREWHLNRNDNLPKNIYSKQQKGFEFWNVPITTDYKNIELKDLPAIKELVDNKTTKFSQFDEAQNNQEKTKYFTVNETELNQFFICPVKWFYINIFKLKDISKEPMLLDDESKGTAYHDILQYFYRAIITADENTTGFVIPDILKIDYYKETLKNIINKYFETKKNVSASLIKPFWEPLTDKTFKILSRFIETELKTFGIAGLKVAGLEEKFECTADGILLTGKIDKYLESDNGFVIIDYKTNKAPFKKDDYKSDGSGNLANFQIAFYIKLLESKNIGKINNKVTDAALMIINTGKPYTIVGKIGSSNGKTRDDFNETIDSELPKKISEFKDTISSLNISNEKTVFENCKTCSYKHICRTTYMLNNDRNVYKQGCKDE